LIDVADEMARKDIEAGLETRHELGDAFDAELVAGFADRIEKTVQERVGATASARTLAERNESRTSVFQFVLGAGSAVAGIPISITLGVTDNLGALVISWVGLVGVNVAHALRTRKR
jgi:hypothetical protein